MISDMKYFLHTMILMYYVTFWDTLAGDIADGIFAKMADNPSNYIGSILYHVWFVSLWFVFAKAIGTDVWLRRSLVFSWILAFAYIVISSR